MRIFAISDLHLDSFDNKPMDIFGDTWKFFKEDIIENAKKNKITDKDIVVIAGDISWAMKKEEAKTDISFLDAIPGKKILIRGNHDYWWKGISGVRDVLPPETYAIQNDAIKFGKFIFCGTRGWNVDRIKPNDLGQYEIKENDGKTKLNEDERILAKEKERLKLTLDAALKMRNKGDEVIVVMHYPPYTRGFQETTFTKMIEAAVVKTVVFGHLHGERWKKYLEVRINNTKYFLTSCDVVDNKLVRIK